MRRDLLKLFFLILKMFGENVCHDSEGKTENLLPDEISSLSPLHPNTVKFRAHSPLTSPLPLLLPGVVASVKLPA